MSTKKSLKVVKGGPMARRFEALADRIARRAYEIFEARDSSEGDELSDWLQAENELLTRMAFEIVDDDDGIKIKGKVDGFAPEEIDVQVWPDRVSIAGLRESEEREGTRHTKRSSSFWQSFELPQKVDSERSEARMEGITLELSLPKMRRRQ